MKKLIGAFSAAAATALAFGPLAAGAPRNTLPLAAAAISPILDDDMDGDDEGSGVVDPVPQDDGSPGVDDPCAPPCN